MQPTCSEHATEAKSPAFAIVWPCTEVHSDGLHDRPAHSLRVGGDACKRPQDSNLFWTP